MDIDREGTLQDADERRLATSDLNASLDDARTASVAREIALREAAECLLRAQAALTQAAAAMERAGAERGSLAHAAEVARTQAHLAETLTSVIHAPANERVELLLAVLGAAQGAPRSGRH